MYRKEKNFEHGNSWGQFFFFFFGVFPLMDTRKWYTQKTKENQVLFLQMV